MRGAFILSTIFFFLTNHMAFLNRLQMQNHGGNVVSPHTRGRHRLEDDVNKGQPSMSALLAGALFCAYKSFSLKEQTMRRREKPVIWVIPQTSKGGAGRAGWSVAAAAAKLLTPVEKRVQNDVQLTFVRPHHSHGTNEKYFPQASPWKRTACTERLGDKGDVTDLQPSRIILSVWRVFN